MKSAVAKGIWNGAAFSRLVPGAKTEKNDALGQQLDDSIHPRLRVLRKSWTNFELFQEYASGLGDVKNSVQLKSLTARKSTLDFSELLDLLRSLQLLFARDAIVFNPHTQVTTTKVYEIFREVNLKEWLQYVGSSGLDGEANVDQCEFNEYQIIMLCIAEELGVPLEELVKEDDPLPEGNNRDVLFQTVRRFVEKARMTGIENKPGTASFLARSKNVKSKQLDL